MNFKRLELKEKETIKMDMKCSETHKLTHVHKKSGCRELFRKRTVIEGRRAPHAPGRPGMSEVLSAAHPPLAVQNSPQSWTGKVMTQDA